MKRLFKFVSLFLSAAVLAFFLGNGTSVSSQEADVQALERATQSIQLCLPKPPEHAPAAAYQFELLTKQESGTQTFHLLLVRDPSDPGDYPWETLISVAGDKCENLIPVRSNVRTLTRFVPQAVANQLALARYKELQKTPAGKLLIKRQLKVNTAPIFFRGAPTDSDMDEYVIAPEDAWAFKQLGIAVPARFRTLPVEAPTKQP